MRGLCETMMRAAGPLKHQVALALMDKSDPAADVFRGQFGDTMFFCPEKDLRPLTRTAACMNAFDVVFCPRLFYLLRETDIDEFLKIMVWSMAPESSFVFAVPNRQRLQSGKIVLPGGVECRVNAKEDSYELRPGLFSRKVRCNRNSVDGWKAAFIRWNALNPRAEWDVDDVTACASGDMVACCVPMAKRIA